MHSRLPHFAGVPGRLSVAAATAALVVSGCAPNFHATEPSTMAPTSDSQDLPQSVKSTADTTMRDAAAAVVQQVAEHQPQAPGTRTEEPGPEDAEESPLEGNADSGHREQPTPEVSVPSDELEDWADSLARAREVAEQEEGQHQAEVEEEAGRQAQTEADTEDEAQSDAEAEQETETETEGPAEEESAEQEHAEPDTEDPTEEEPAQQEHAEPDTEDPTEEEPAQQEDPDPEPEPEPELEEPTPAPEPPAESPEVSFDGDLDAFLTETANVYPGRISISLQEVGGQSRSGSTGGADSFVTGSTYKLLVGYSLIREVESGERSWEDTALGDRDLAQCFNDMLVISDNPCPEAIGPEIGWTEIYADAAAVGATNTSGGEGGIRTNAHDLTRFMTSLATGSMSMSDSGHERLRNALAANVHRQGIPAGSTGRVLNKPGFINGNLHDTAIVHHPAGTYVLTILSQGSSWSSLAGITRDIESALYR
ncbi:serine hydrolase [Nesterenkonia natronophila]|uniref:Beta-lactamase class A catalytic domain-containing protein n=1 Tax=Nesterenkonia natronophila TaxID=2174932 RepID=A0A3A4F4P0_9MICC|nr:serine hydrolase [Nesterenkonia natronophila]RJN31440.1 hypothetical protein D3250_11485 [Nesterenkonia natronophila]